MGEGGKEGEEKGKGTISIDQRLLLAAPGEPLHTVRPRNSETGRFLCQGCHTIRSTDQTTYSLSEAEVL